MAIGMPQRSLGSASLLVAAVLCLLAAEPASSFFPSSANARTIRNLSPWARVHVRHQVDNKHSRKCVVVSKDRHIRNTPPRGYGRVGRATITMERASGRFQRLAKPKFDRNNPNAVLGKVEVDGLEQARLRNCNHVFM